MSQTARRQSFFKRHKSEYPVFSGWNRTLVDANHMLVPLVAMSEAEMEAMPEEARETRGIPAMICLHPLKRTVEVYPVPDQDYDAVTETKSWSVG